MRPLAWDTARMDQAADAEYRKDILMAMAVNGMTQDKLAAALGMSRNTLRARLRNPETLTRGEDRTLRRLLGLNTDNLLDWRDLDDTFAV